MDEGLLLTKLVIGVGCRELFNSKSPVLFEL
jgi:hypothetical protein